MTERLYLHDPYTTEFEAEILERRETDSGLALVFAATFFYPESGGQPFDLGTIGGVPVIGVEEADDTILHFVERFPEEDRVLCRIDPVRRRDHMQQHSGQHILSAAFVSEAQAQTTSFHLGAHVSTIDLDRHPLSLPHVERAQKAANDAVRRALPIRSRIVSPDEARQLDLRKLPPESDALRIVQVEGLDTQACCGTHPQSSAEVGPILIRHFEKFKDGTRVHFVCGDRALADYNGAVDKLRALGSILSSSEAELELTAEKIVEERKSLGKELRALREEILLQRGATWMEDAPRHGGVALVTKELGETGPGELRKLAAQLASEPKRVLLLGSVAEGKAHLVFACSADVTQLDAGAVLKTALAAVGGRGGGSDSIAQGGGPETDGLHEALARAAKAAAKALAK